MGELKATQAYIEKKDSKIISIRAIKLGIDKVNLFKLLSQIPLKELKQLVDKYLK